MVKQVRADSKATQSQDRDIIIYLICVTRHEFNLNVIDLLDLPQIVCLNPVIITPTGVFTCHQNICVLILEAVVALTPVVADF